MEMAWYLTECELESMTGMNCGLHMIFMLWEIIDLWEEHVQSMGRT